MGKILSAILLLIAFSQLALAQGGEKSSSGEDVAIAFFKKGGNTPDFTKWAMNADKHAVVPKAREKQYLDKELLRLNTKWNTYDPEKNLIAVKAHVDVTLNSVLKEDGNASYSMTMAFDKGTVDYFPFKFQDYWIAVMVEKLNDHMTQALPEEQFRLIHSTFDEKQKGRAILSFLLRPLKADLSQPYDMDGHEQWMFVTEIAGLSLKDSRGVPLWNFTAPWHVTDKTRDVRDMFIRQESKEQADDAAEGIAP